MSIKLATALGGNVDSSVATLGDGQPSWSANANLGPGAIVITSTAGATPTVTVNIQSSVDNVTWVNQPYATPTTFVTTALTVTTSVTTIYLVQAPSHAAPYAYLKLVLSANTNVTLTAAYYY